VSFTTPIHNPLLRQTVLLLENCKQATLFKNVVIVLATLVRSMHELDESIRGADALELQAVATLMAIVD
jgi:hypothetical protein